MNLKKSHKWNHQTNVLIYQQDLFGDLWQRNELKRGEPNYTQFILDLTDSLGFWQNLPTPKN